MKYGDKVFMVYGPPGQEKKYPAIVVRVYPDLDSAGNQFVGIAVDWPSELLAEGLNPYQQVCKQGSESGDWTHAD